MNACMHAEMHEGMRAEMHAEMHAGMRTEMHAEMHAGMHPCMQKTKPECMYVHRNACALRVRL